MKLEPVIKMEQRLDQIKSEAIEKDGVHIHMGCGPNVLKGFVNVDKFHQHPQVLNVCMSETPFEEESVNLIYSSHSLEHLPIRKAQIALRHWKKILKKGGRLFLAVPDLEFICHAMTSETVDWNTKWQWLQYCLFGWQAPSSVTMQDNSDQAPNDPGQYHQSGFSMDYLKWTLTNMGFQVKDHYRYDGYGTPSIWLEAIS